MSPRHFTKAMFSPYFQTEHYKNESTEMVTQRAIEKKLARLLFWKNKKNENLSNNN